MTSVTIPNSVTEIGGGAFQDCSGLTSVTLPNSVTVINGATFFRCTKLTSLNFPDSLTMIGSDAFYGTPWYNNQPDGLIYVGMVAYKYKGTMPQGTSIVLEEGCVGIAGNAFAGCSGLTSVAIPNSVTSIGNYAFGGCSGLTSVTIPNSVTSIGDEAFCYCSGLTSVTIGNSVTTIGNSAFNSCTGLTSVTIGNSVTSIGTDAFNGCSSLNSISLPNSVTEIGSRAFSGTAWYYNQPNGLIYAGNVAYNYKGTMPQGTSIVLEEGCVGIATYAFGDCSGLTSVTIPNSVTTIGDYAFYGCTNLTSVTIPNSVTSIGQSAFRRSGLTEVTIPNSVKTIGEWAFSSCSGLTSMVVESGNTVFDSRNNCNAIIKTKSNTLINGCNNSFIPSSVTSIGDHAFESCTGLTSVTIPNSVTSIGGGAFESCSGLTSIEIPNSVTVINDGAFFGCSGLTYISIPNSVTSIGYGAFSNVYHLHKFEWNVKTCNGNSNLFDTYSHDVTIDTLVFGNEVQVIPYNTFDAGSKNLNIKYMVIPNTVNQIENDAFNAKYLYFSTLTLTGKGEWNYNPNNYPGLSSSMSKFKNVNIGSEITSLGGFGFSPDLINCYSAVPPTCQEGTFVNYNGKLHVPTTSTVSYFTADYWQNFTNIINDVNEKVILNQTTADLVQNDTLKLTANTIPEGNNVIWRSSNSSLATVSDNGVVTARGNGECDIFATLESNYAVYASCHVNFSVPNLIITIDKDNAILGANQILTVYPTCSPDVPVELVVTSSDPGVAVARVVNRTNAPALGLKSFPEKGMALAMMEELAVPSESKDPALASTKAIMIVGVQNGTATITVTTADGQAEPAVLELRVVDVNSDNVVTAADVTALYKYILNGDLTYYDTSDINGDGNITVADITAVYKLLLGN